MKLTKQEEFDLWKSWKSNKDTSKLNTLLQSFEPLIQKEVNIFKASPLPPEAIKLKAFTLTKQAFDTYDPNLSQLNTHVTNVLKKLNRYIYENQNIGKIPEHRVLRIAQFKSSKDQLKDQLRREPTALEMAGEMKIPIQEIERLESELRKDLTIRNEVTEEEGGGFFLDPQIFSDKTSEAVHFVYYTLSDPMDQKILEKYFGLFGNPKENIFNISSSLNLSYAKVNKKLKEFADLIDKTELNLS